MENLHIFSLKYIEATNVRPARIKITSERHNKSITVSRNCNEELEEQAIKILQE